MKKFLHWFVRIVIALVVLVLAFYGEENWRGKHAWEKYRHERESKGDRFEWSSIVQPPIPDAENFAATPFFAALFPSPSGYPHFDAIRLPDCSDDARGRWLRGRVGNLAMWQKAFTNDNLLAALAKYDPILTEITEASHRPKCRFPISQEDFVKVQMPQLQYSRSLARIYLLRAQAELAAGQSDAALSDVQTCLRLAKALDDEPVMILSYLVRTAIIDLAVQAVWEGLATHRWSEAQLGTLQTEFERMDQFNAYAHALRGGRMFIYANIHNWIDHRELFIAELLNGWAPAKFVVPAIPTGWFYQNLLKVERYGRDNFLTAVDWDQRRISPHSLQYLLITV